MINIHYLTYNTDLLCMPNWTSAVVNLVCAIHSCGHTTALKLFLKMPQYVVYLSELHIIYLDAFIQYTNMLSRFRLEAIWKVL